MKKKTDLAFLFSILFLLLGTNLSAQIQKGSDIDGQATDDNFGTSISMGGPNTVAISAVNHDAKGNDAGQVRIYRWNGSKWVQKGNPIDGEAAEDRSGNALSMADSNTIAIGAARNDGNGTSAGHVRIYAWNGSSWVQKGKDIDGEAAGDQCGWSVSMADENTVAMGAVTNDGNGRSSGQVRVFRWSGSSWVQKGSDIDGEAAGDNMGSAVSMPDPNTVAIGAYGNNGNGSLSGHVRIYRWNGSSWVQKGGDIDGEAAGDYMGSSVSMPDSNTIATGAYGNDGNGNDAGHVRVYSWNGSKWVQKGADIDGEAAGDISGISLSMPTPNTLAIGASGNDGNGSGSGQVRIYRWSGSAWVQRGSDMDGEAAGDNWGGSVSMPDSGTVAAGALGNDGNGSNSGQARVFEICDPSKGTDVQSACDSFTWIDGITYSASNNTASYKLQNASGCDSVVTLDLTILHSSSAIDRRTACDSFTWIDGITYTSPTKSAIYKLRNDAGCDSLIHLDLAVNYSSIGTDVRTACDSFTWIDGITYTSSPNNVSYKLTNASGCDSLVHLDLTIDHSKNGTDVRTACDSFTWIDGITYTASNNSAIYTLRSATGCDSLVALDLTINYASKGTDVQTACASYIWLDGIKYTSNNTRATFNIKGGSASGCDSLVTLDLTIKNVSDIGTTTSGNTITANNESASYRWLNCTENYAVIPGESERTFTPASTGSYAVELTENDCIDTSDCVNISIVGLAKNPSSSAYKIYPNPTSGKLYIVSLDKTSSVRIAVSDLLGRELFRKNYTSTNEMSLAIEGPSGFYFVEISDEDEILILKVLKE